VQLRTGAPDEGSVPLQDLLRRLQARGIEVTPFEDGFQLARGTVVEVYFFDDPVSEAEVRRIADVFRVRRLELYFERTERDLS
jgi:hypothetical protein